MAIFFRVCQHLLADHCHDQWTRSPLQPRTPFSRMKASCVSFMKLNPQLLVSHAVSRFYPSCTLFLVCSKTCDAKCSDRSVMLAGLLKGLLAGDPQRKEMVINKLWASQEVGLQRFYGGYWDLCLLCLLRLAGGLQPEMQCKSLAFMPTAALLRGFTARDAAARSACIYDGKTLWSYDG